MFHLSFFVLLHVIQGLYSLLLVSEATGEASEDISDETSNTCLDEFITR